MKDDTSNNDSVNEPNLEYNRQIRVFHSFKEQEDFLMDEMAKLTSHEILIHMRKFINVAYGMHGYNPKELPKTHEIKNLKYIN